MVDEVRDGLRRAVGSWPRRLLILGAVLLGVGVAATIPASAPPAERTLLLVLGPVQSAVSILTPLVGIVLVDDLRRTRSGGTVGPTLLAGLVVAAGLALAGVLISVVAVALAGGGLTPWGRLTLGSLLVQGVALLTGSGLGLLIRSRVLAFLATIVLPLGLWLLLGSTAALEPARGWLTPYESVRRLLGGGMTSASWLQFAVMAAIWGGGLNAWGAARLRPRGSVVGRRTGDV